MRSSTPPKAAFWLFNRLGPRNTELAGDLIEEYKSGRSAAWYWRQVLIAIAVGFRTEVSNHKFLAFKAVAISWTVLYVGLYNRLLHFPAHSSITRFFIASGDRMFGVHVPLEFFATSLVSALIVGWANRRFHRFALLILLASFTLSFGYFTFSQWIRLIVNSIAQPRFRPYLGYLLLQLLAGIAGMVVGGIWSAPAAASSATNDNPTRVDQRSA